MLAHALVIKLGFDVNNWWRGGGFAECDLVEVWNLRRFCHLIPSSPSPFRFPLLRPAKGALRRSFGGCVELGCTV